ncbi:MAG: sarcosine oxidase subunit beta family protein [Geminicoccaceae bacterium]
MHYNALNLLRGALSGQGIWPRAWRDAVPKERYQVIIVGGGGHGLATAYYLAKEHGITDVAVLEKGWIGSGNTGRNTTIVRSNYMLDANAHFYEWSLKLWEGLSRDLNYNVMFSPRGVLNLAHNPAQRDAYLRRGNAMRLNGIDARWLGRDEIARRVPILDTRDRARFPIVGGLLQPRAGTARHDAVAWGFARAADRRGVNIVQNCEVLGFVFERDRIVGVETTRGTIRAPKIGLAVAGQTSVLAEKAGLRLPIESHLLQAFVSEGLKPLLDTVVTFGAQHFYISQSDKGGLVFGGDLDGYNSYAQRGNLPVVEDVITGGIAMIPALSRLRLLRHWGGVMDMTMDGSPIIAKTPVPGLYINGGWCYGGFKATPGSGWVFAHTIAHDRPHWRNAPFTIERFSRGAVLDEGGKGPVPGWH